MNIRLLLIGLCILSFASCKQENKQEQKYFNEAYKNGLLVNEGYNRCLNYVNDWLNFTDEKSGLIPENLTRGIDTWNGHNSAADNYPFMVLTSFLLDKGLYNGQMLNMLHSERKLTSRLKSLPDAYSFSKQDFKSAELDTFKILFGTSEYIKDGLIPLTEYIGNTPWSNRMIEMLDDLSAYVNVFKNTTGNKKGSTVETEINGELLQTLSRIYWMTNDEKYLEWAIKIADYYLLENPNNLLTNKRLRLRDHGCEIIGGLSEIYVTLHYKNPNKKETYKKSLYKLFDRILEIGRNEDGMFYNEVNMLSGEIVDQKIVDNWGYLYNAYYSVFLVDNHTAYRNAVLKPFDALPVKYTNYNWERKGADGFADAIESGINLLNREPSANLEKWINSEIQLLWSIQDSSFRQEAQRWKNRGIVEGWHGDGNFARTTIMYCLYKTKDVTVEPWRNDLVLGTFEKEGELYISLQSSNDWNGLLHFGKKRHQEILNLPIDYPRINQFPEWYPISKKNDFIITKNNKEYSMHFNELKNGLEISLKKDIPTHIKVKRIHHSPNNN